MKCAHHAQEQDLIKSLESELESLRKMPFVAEWRKLEAQVKAADELAKAVQKYREYRYTKLDTPVYVEIENALTAYENSKEGK